MLIVALTQHRALHAIVEDLTRHAGEVLEGLHMQPQQRLQILVQAKAREQVAAVSQHHREQPHHAHHAGLIVEHDLEVCEVHLRLRPGRGLEAHLEQRGCGRAHLAYEVA